jgi:hypothetical protein
MVNGDGLVAPPPFARLTLWDDLSPAMIEHLRTYFHPRYVVLREDLYPSDEAPDFERMVDESREDLKPVAHLGGTRIFEVLPRSRGARLRRWYPASLLKGKRGVALDGHLAGVRDDLDVIVRLTADNQPLAQWSDQTFLPDILQFVPFKTPPGRQVTLDLAADYWIRPGVERPQVGRTGVRAAADVQVTGGLNRSAITVNNRTWITTKGYTLAAIDPVARSVEIRNFNTSWYEEDSERLAAYVATLPPGRIVAIATNFDVSRRLTAAAVQALNRLGLKEDLRGRPDEAHGGVGVVGAPPGTAVECVGRGSTSCGAGTRVDVHLDLKDFRLY